jgi:hypothetical protein
MSTSTPFALRLLFLFPLCFVPLGCADGQSASPAEDKEPAAKPPESRKVEVGRNVFLEVQGDRRRVLVHSTVCLRMGPLELLMCRKQSKEHESILTADIDARDLHKALLATGAETGSPCEYQPKYKPATGTPIKIFVQYEHKGKLVTQPAGHWIRNMKTQKELKEHWVFAGSRFVKNVLDPKRPDIYLANEGDVVTVSNFEDSLLDLPIPSPKDDADRAFEAFTEHIPAVDTKVTIILEPVLKAAKPKK